MRQKQKNVMVLCDEEEEYAGLMSEYLRRQKNLPWEVDTYTSPEELLARETELDMLVVAESAYREEMQRLHPARTVILSESGTARWEGVQYVDKYSRAEEVLRQLLLCYAEIADTVLPQLRCGAGTKFIGNYSPVRRSMQTSFALTLGQMLAQEHRTLYLNFEHYAGMGELLPDMQTLDMADLLYFLNAEGNKFLIRMQSMIRHLGRLDYVPPMRAGQNLLTVPVQEWLELLEKLGELGEYEYVVLDLSESMQGLFDILRRCSRVFTTAAKDAVAERKLMQYEQILMLYEYGDILEKTKQLDFSHIRKLPADPELLTKGEMAEAVREVIRDL